MLNETQDPVGVYLDSLSALERAERAVARLAASMTDAATRTQGHDGDFAVKVAASPGPSGDAVEWPTGIEISLGRWLPGTGPATRPATSGTASRKTSVNASSRPHSRRRCVAGGPQHLR